MSHTYAGNSIAIVSSTDANPIAIVATAHGRSTGDVVAIAGHLINTRANGERTITVTGANGFTLDSSGAATGAGAGGATGTVTAFAPTATLPDDITDQRSAASVNTPFQTLADRCQMLYRDYKQRMLGLFPIVPARSFTRVLQSTPNFGYIGATNLGWVQNQGAALFWQHYIAGSDLFIPLDLPHGAIFTAFNVYIQGSSVDVALPATMPTVIVYKVAKNTGITINMAGIVTATDASANLAAYQAVHAIGTTGGTEAIDRTAFRYHLRLRPESGAGSNVGTLHYAAEATYTLNATDPGAA